MLSLVLLFGFEPLVLPTFVAATVVSAMYFVAMALAPHFPGTRWVDPEFEEFRQKRSD